MITKKKEVKKDKEALSLNAKRLDLLICSRHPIIYIVTPEEERAMQDIIDIAAITEKTLYTWDCVSGVMCNSKTVKSTGADANSSDETYPLAMLDFIRKNIDDSDNKDGETKREGKLFVLCDLFRYLQNPIEPKIERMLRCLANDILRVYSTIIIISPELHIPISLEKRISIIDYDYPTPDEIGFHLNSLVENVKQLKGFEKFVMNDEKREAIIKASQGLTLQEADNAYSKSIVQLRDITPIKIIEEKKQIIRKSGLLEFFETDEGMENIGGMKYLIEWLKKRKAAFTDKAKEYGLPHPSGLILMGIQGCGKSLAAKATAVEWQMPLLRLDIGRVFGGFVGDSERNIRDALRIAESIAPCVLWLDEVDKGISGVQSSGRTDGGTTSRVYGTLLTWLQEKKKAVFVIATANKIEGLDAAFLRKGRFDEIFFVNLPNFAERKEIASIHIKRRHRDPKKFDLDAFAKATKEFSGAEIEASIIDALFEGFQEDGRDITTEDLINASREIHPLSEVMAEEITKIREWAIKKAKNASCKIKPEERVAAGGRVNSLEID